MQGHVGAVKGDTDAGGNAALERIRLVIERLFRERTAVARSDGTVHDLFPVAINGAEGEALREWVKRENATCTIEVGLGYGVAALFVCEGLLANADATGRHVAIDPYQATSFANCGLQFLDEAGVVGFVEHKPDESEIVLPRFLTEGRSFDLGFVDGNHRFDSVFIDLVYLGRLVRAGGIIFVDDFQLPSVARAVSFCTTNLGWKIEEVSTDDDFHHWIALRTAYAPPQRPFDHYVDF
jgi:predicted O-methyltransferase YrrM